MLKFPLTIGKSKGIRIATMFDRVSRKPPRSVRWGFYAVAIGALIAAHFDARFDVFFPLAFAFPILLASWWDGRRGGYLLAGISTILMAPSQPLIPGLMRAAVLVVLIEMVCRTSDMTRRVRVLEGLLSMCGFCHRIRDKKGQWVRLERYLQDHSEAGVLQTYCSECMEVR